MTSVSLEMIIVLVLTGGDRLIFTSKIATMAELQNISGLKLRTVQRI